MTSRENMSVPLIGRAIPRQLRHFPFQLRPTLLTNKRRLADGHRLNMLTRVAPDFGRQHSGRLLPRIRRHRNRRPPKLLGALTLPALIHPLTVRHILHRPTPRTLHRTHPLRRLRQLRLFKERDDDAYRAE